MAKSPVPPPPRRAVRLDQLIENSPQFEQFEKNYLRINRGLNVNNIVHELLHLHGTRRIRTMDSGDIIANSQVRLVDANMQNQAYRSRAVELKVQLFIASSELYELNDTFWKWSAQAFGPEMTAQGHKSQGAQWNFVSTVIAFSVTRLSQIDRAIKVADMIVDDLDQCGWALKRVEGAVGLTMKDR